MHTHMPALSLSPSLLQTHPLALPFIPLTDKKMQKIISENSKKWSACLSQTTGKKFLKINIRLLFFHIRVEKSSTKLLFSEWKTVASDSCFGRGTRRIINVCAFLGASGCSTVVERTPCDHEIIDSNPTKSWTFLSPLYFSISTSL